MMGVGGGFIMIPAMVYILGMSTNVVVGTSLFQIIFVTANSTFFQSYLNQTVDIVLSALMILGGVIGAQIGGIIGSKLKAETSVQPRMISTQEPSSTIALVL